MHTSWGSNPIGFLNFSSLHLIFDPDDVSPWKTNIFRLGTCAIMKSVEGLIHSLNLISFGMFFELGILNHVLIWVFDIIWTSLFLVTLVCDLLV